MNIIRLCALTLLGLLPVLGQAQDEPMAFSATHYKYFPVPASRPGDLPVTCSSDKTFPTESSIPREQLWRYRYQLSGWAGIHFKIAYPCVNHDYVIRRWQETIGTQVTGTLSTADAKAIEETMVRVAPQFAEEAERFHAPRRAKAEAQRAANRKQIDESDAKWVSDLLPAPPIGYNEQCGLLKGKLDAQVSGEMRRIGELPEVQRIPAGPARVKMISELSRQISNPHLLVHPEWEKLWADYPTMVDWAERYDCRTDVRYQVEIWQMALGAAPDAMNASLVADSRKRLSEATAQLARMQAEQDQNWMRLPQNVGVGRTLALDKVDSATQLSMLVAQMPTDRCNVGMEALRCGAPTTNCAVHKAALSKLQAERQRQRTPHYEPPHIANANAARRSAFGLTIEVQMELRQAEQAVRQCELKRSVRSQLLWGGEAVNDLEVQAYRGKVASMRFAIAGDLQRMRNALNQRYGAPKVQEVATSYDEVTHTPNGIIKDPVTGGEIHLFREQVNKVTQTATKYVWQQKGTVVENLGKVTTFNFVGSQH